MAFFVSLLYSLEVIFPFFPPLYFARSAKPAGGSIPARMLRVHMRFNCLFFFFPHIHDPYLFISQEKPLKAKRTNNNNNRLKKSSNSKKLTK